jgi:ferritin-like metal-binding protein YciE
MDELFEHELQDIYFAAHELTTAYERMAELSEDEEIEQLFRSHLDETATHIDRLVEVFEESGEPPQTEECEGIEGLLTEWEEFVEEGESGPVLDYYNLVTAMKTERYEQSAYESLVALARESGRDDAADLLQSNLEEDEAALDDISEAAASYDYDSLS